MNQLFFPAIEQKPLEEIAAYQDHRLREALNYAWQNSPFYRNLFSLNHIDVDRIRSVSDLKRIPVTNKEDLQKYNRDFLCVPADRIIDYITTSGTLGDPVTFAMTDKDLDRLAYNEAISFTCAGGSASDIYQLMT
ncbi:MAG TPA: phenylacetate--CoA ligase family protein, partial [Bacteroidales bacterium]|nr:phenylacetate--CoA ligase family protein [Bacteroidales bacterium]